MRILILKEKQRNFNPLPVLTKEEEVELVREELQKGFSNRMMKKKMMMTKSSILI
jgi:hypothetical protein